MENQHIDNKKCYNCGKEFRTPSDLLKHKNRKTPCLIREVAVDQLNNPNRCIYCNKILSKKEHLTRHWKNCKVKNGGVEILFDKVRYEQELRILKEEKQLEKEQKDREIAELNAKVDKLENLKEEFENLKKQIIDVKPNQVVIGGNINNIDASKHVTININNYRTPSLDKLTITTEDLLSAVKLSRLLFDRIYCNPAVPENHSVLLKNKKEKEILVHDDGWKVVRGENMQNVFNGLTDSVVMSADTLVNGKDRVGAYPKNFNGLPEPARNKIIDFNTRKDRMNEDEYLETLISNKSLLKDTIMQTDCPLLSKN